MWMFHRIGFGWLFEIYEVLSVLCNNVIKFVHCPCVVSDLNGRCEFTLFTWDPWPIQTLAYLPVTMMAWAAALLQLMWPPLRVLCISFVLHNVWKPSRKLGILLRAEVLNVCDLNYTLRRIPSLSIQFALSSSYSANCRAYGSWFNLRLYGIVYWQAW